MRKGTRAIEVKVGDTLESVFGNQFPVIRRKQNGHNIILTVVDLTDDTEMEWRFLWSDLIYVSVDTEGLTYLEMDELGDAAFNRRVQKELGDKNNGR